MKDLWMRVEMYNEDIVVVDCGYLSEQKSRDRADKIFALGIGKSNLCWDQQQEGIREYTSIFLNRKFPKFYPPYRLVMGNHGMALLITIWLTSRWTLTPKDRRRSVNRWEYLK